jgi:hypothetical protein
METRKLTLNQDRARTLADRTGSIILRHAGIPEVASTGAMVAPLAAEYIAIHEALKTKRLVARAALQAGRAAVAELDERYRMWRGALARDLPGFDRADYDATAATPNALFADSKQLVTVARERGSDLPYGSLLVSNLTPLIERAEEAWTVGQGELAELQSVQRELRGRGASFLAGLVRLRIILRAMLGSQHRDYQALRATRRSHDDEVPEIGGPEIVEAAATSAVTASSDDSTA